jgi:hypothetical protein
MSTAAKRSKGVKRNIRNREPRDLEALRPTHDLSTAGWCNDWLTAEWFRDWEACARQAR